MHGVIVISDQSKQQQLVSDAIKIIAAGVGAQIGEHFFPTLVRHLAQVFSSDYAFIGILDEYDSKKVNMIAVAADGEQIPNFSYELDGTPCDEVVNKRICVYRSKVQELFPNDKLLQEMGVEAYIGTPLYDSTDQPIGLIAVMAKHPLDQVQLVTEILDIFAVRVTGELQRLKQEAHIRRIAYEDYLTRLPNRALLHEELKSALAKVRVSGKTGAFLLIDLDHFKTINDALGHDVGDEVLRAIARRLRQVITPNEIVGRLGGDEFVVLIKETTLNYEKLERYSQALGQRIIRKLCSPVFVGERAFNVGASIGIALFPQDTITELDILRHADMALYRAKSLGRGQMQLYLPDLKIAAKNRLQLEEGLRQAIANQELELHYQPQVGPNGEMLGAEVLLRWNHPELGNIPPNVFIPVAEDTGLIHSIGQWVFEESCQHLKQWLEEGYPFRGHLSINVCPWQFARPDFVNQLQEIIQYHRIAPHYLIIELTETALLHDVQDAVKKLNILRSLGMKIALDDFGTGYSSLAHLRDLPLDIIKIDKAFVNELDENKDHGLVESIISIGQLMKLDVVAEGVEQATQVERLRQLQCRMFQGYYFSRPLPEKPFLEWMVKTEGEQG